MSCQAIKSGEVKTKGKASIEGYDNNGKPIYYCLGYNDSSTDCPIKTCSECKKHVFNA